MLKKELQIIIEIIQYTLLGFWISAILGCLLNSIESDLDENTTTFGLVIDISFNLTLLALLIHFLNKILKKIPLIIVIVDNYKTVFNKFSIGTAVGVGLIFTITQTKLQNKISILRSRIFN